MRLELKPFGVDVVLIDPGSFKTNIWNTTEKITNKSLNKQSPYYQYLRKIENEIEKGMDKFGDPVDVAKLITNIALKKDVKQLRFLIGKGVKMIVFIKKFIPLSLWEKIILKKLLK